MTKRPNRLKLRLLDDIIEGIREFRMQLRDAVRQGRFQPQDPHNLTTAVLIFVVILLGGLLIARLLERL